MSGDDALRSKVKKILMIRFAVHLPSVLHTSRLRLPPAFFTVVFALSRQRFSLSLAAPLPASPFYCVPLGTPTRATGFAGNLSECRGPGDKPARSFSNSSGAGTGSWGRTQGGNV